MIKLFVNNEFSQLRKVILGIGEDFGGCPELKDAYDPKSKENILANTFPIEKDVKRELINLENIFNKYKVKIVRPHNIIDCNQIFARDVGFVIEDQFFISNMIKNRSLEINGLNFFLNRLNPNKVNHLPDDIFVEGGDVVVAKDYLFIGFSSAEQFSKYKVSRTNRQALEYFSKKFPNKKIIGLELKKSDTVSLENCLHLDCCFQPLGLNHVIVYPDGFRCKKDIDLIYDIFEKKQVIVIDKQEMSNMFSNIFSISNNVVVSERKFHRLNTLLREYGYIVEEVDFAEISKMGGLLRCATLPLIREHEE